MKEESKYDKHVITLNTVVFHNPEMVTAPMDSELVMFSLERGMYYGLDNIASAIWQHIEKPILVSDLCTVLLNEFDVDLETCQRETLVLLNWLFHRELVKIEPTSG